MKINFIYPRFEKFLDSVANMKEESRFFTVGKFTCPPALGIPILAAITPPDIDIAFTDDNAGEPLDFEDGSDLYAISSFTPQGTRALEIARMCKERGKKCVMGGMFPSFMPDECLKYADSVCVGEGELIWPQVIEDMRSGKLRPLYKASRPVDMADVPEPRRDLFYGKQSYDWDEDLIQLTRGCYYDCAMCIIPRHMGGRIRFKPIDMAVDEISRLKFENVYLTDDSLFFPQKSVREYAEKFFDAVADSGKKFFVSSTLALNCGVDFIEKAAKAGVRNFYCTMNVDPLSIALLRGDDRGLRARFKDFADTLRGLGIGFFASFGIGRDWDDDSISDRVLELCSYADINTAEFFIFSPYPGSRHWDRLMSQGRITSRQWHKYNGANVVFKPARMSADTLYSQFVNCWKGFYDMNHQRNIAHMEPSVWDKGEISISKSMQKRGVGHEAAITGIGILSPVGCDKESVVQALREGRDGISEASKIDTSRFVGHLCAEVKDFNPSLLMSESEMRTFTDPYLRMAICAARMALRDAGIDLRNIGKKFGMVLATCNAGLNSGEIEYRKKYGDSSARFDLSVSSQSEFYAVAKAMSSALGISGDCWVVNTACSGSTAAIGLAESLIESGDCEIVLVGGADAVALSNYAGFCAIKVVSPNKIAPFSTPEGMNIGEGAAFWIIENMGAALLRRARCYGKVIGHASGADAHHPTQPDPRGDGAFRVMKAASDNAGVNPEDLGCINAHGSGTAANDMAESKGILKFLGSAKLPITSTKSYMGHCMGATGILEATCQLLAMNENFIPATLHNVGLRSGCKVEALDKRLDVSYDCFLSANYAFAGNNAAIVVAKRDFISPLPKSRESGSEKIVISGVGAVSPLGLTVADNLSALNNGVVAIGCPERFHSDSMSGNVRLPSARSLDRRLDLSGMNPISIFATLAAKSALDSSGLKIRRELSDKVGLAMSVSRGSNEAPHMDAVFSSKDRKGNVACFSNVTANSTAGWVSKALELRGANITLTSGSDCGLQAVEFARRQIADGAATAMLAVAADELYAQELCGYSLVGRLYSGEEQKDFRLSCADALKTVMGEGAVAFMLERESDAKTRGAAILGEIMGFGAFQSGGDFLEPDLGGACLKSAVIEALEKSRCAAEDIDLIVFSPFGNAQDKKVLDLATDMFEGVPLITTVFNTGKIETTSAMLSLACALSADRLWPQITGNPDIDGAHLPDMAKRILCISSGFTGNNYALVIGREP